MDICLIMICLVLGLVTISSTLQFLDKPNCTQQGLKCTSQVNNCSGQGRIVNNLDAPRRPLWRSTHVGVARLRERGDLLPVMSVNWSALPDASAMSLTGTEVHILEETSNQSLCVSYIFLVKFESPRNPNGQLWTFSLDNVVVTPRSTYLVTFNNLPKPKIGVYSASITVGIPGCEEPEIKTARVCVENGSLWDPHMTGYLNVDGDRVMIVLGFHTGEFSEQYMVSMCYPGFQFTQHLSMENRTSINVTFELDKWQLPPCEIFFRIQPFFKRCQNDCVHHTRSYNYCHNYRRPPNYTNMFILTAALGLLICGFFTCLLLRRSNTGSEESMLITSKDERQDHVVRKRNKVLIIYSLDHPLYRNIVLNLCAFLVAKCGTEVVLDLLDSTRLGMMGRIQWLDWQREQIDKNIDKIFILCSRGVRAKWRAMCGGEQVILKEDAQSPIGDMLTPALGIMVPHLVRMASFQKYMVAYFENVSSEEDVPPPFNITVKYKLMKHFEEVIFRILDIEKQEPGRVNRIEGIAEDEYFHCPSGRALRDAIEAFHAYQLEHPHWFEEELVKDSDVLEDESFFDGCAGSETAESLITKRLPELQTDLSTLVNNVTFKE